MKQIWGMVGVVLGVSFGCGDDDPGSSPGTAGDTSDGGRAGEGAAAAEDGGGPVTPTAGQAPGGQPSAPMGGAASLGGEAAGGDAAGGARTADSAGAAGSAGAAEEGGAAGATSGNCDSAQQCDDGIACTVDFCNAKHRCEREADSSLCPAAAGECFACEVGAGCVERTPITTELLTDKDFDELSGAWEEESVTWFYTIFEGEFAHTPEYLVEFGPADLDAVEQEHATMSQSITIPAGTQKLEFSGRYQLYPGGTELDINDSVRVALHLGKSSAETHLFNVWSGFEPEITFWKGFSYEATRAEVVPLLGKQARLQFVANTWDTVFDIDSVSLQATTCPQN